MSMMYNVDHALPMISCSLYMLVGETPPAFCDEQCKTLSGNNQRPKIVLQAPPEPVKTTRSGRVVRPPARYRDFVWTLENYKTHQDNWMLFAI